MKRRSHLGNLGLVGGLIGGVVVCDQATKALVRTRIAPTDAPVEVLPFLDIRHVHNTGVAFGLFSEQKAVTLVGAAIIAVLLVLWLVRSSPDTGTLIGAGIILGGAAGNAIDRVRLGHVTDFIHVPHWPSFNVADIAISIGVVIVVLAQLRLPPETDQAEHDPDHSGERPA